MTSAAPGSLVAWWKEGEIALAIVLAVERDRVRLLGPGGREDRVPLARIALEIEPSGHVPGTSSDDRSAAGRRAAAVADRVRLRASEVDVPALWEVVHEVGEAQPLAALSELALGDVGPVARAATAAALMSDGLHFVRRGDGWEARGAAAVADIRLQRSREAERAAERDGAIGVLRVAARGGAFVSSGTATERRLLDALEHLAVFDDGADEARRTLAEEALAAVGAPGDRPAERAFRLLRAVGRFGSDDENLAVRRFGLRTEFSPEILLAAKEAAERGPTGQREDRTTVPVLTIDAAHTREVDDGLSIERLPSGRVLVGVHIADPAAFLDVGTALDREAMERTTSHYLPDRRIPMIPPVLSEGAASLIEGESRPALSFFAEIGPDGEIVEAIPRRTLVRVGARLDYDEADRALRDGGAHAEALRDLAEAAERLRRRRVSAGAIVFDAEEVEVRVDGAGEPRLERIDPRSPSRRLVSEAMVLVGSLAARFCIDRRIPAIFRRQPPPTSALAVPPDEPLDPAALRALRRSLRRGEVGIEPGPHFALGLEAYAQASSPLRRFQDLVVHRQIIAALDGAAPAYAVEDLRTIAGITDRAESEGRRAERAADAYWRLKYLERQASRDVDAVVVDLQPVVVQLVETLVEARLPGLTGAALGERLRLRVERVNPRADLLLLRVVS